MFPENDRYDLEKYWLNATFQFHLHIPLENLLAMCYYYIIGAEEIIEGCFFVSSTLRRTSVRCLGSRVFLQLSVSFLFHFCNGSIGISTDPQFPTNDSPKNTQQHCQRYSTC